MSWSAFQAHRFLQIPQTSLADLTTMGVVLFDMFSSPLWKTSFNVDMRHPTFPTSFFLLLLFCGKFLVTVLLMEEEAPTGERISLSHNKTQGNPTKKLLDGSFTWRSLIEVQKMTWKWSKRYYSNKSELWGKPPCNVFLPDNLHCCQNIVAHFIFLAILKLI